MAIYAGSALDSQQRIILAHQAQKGRGYAEARRQLAVIAAIEDPAKREEALDNLIIEADEAADLGKVSKGFARGWLLGLDDWNAEQATRMDGVEMMPITENEEA